MVEKNGAFLQMNGIEAYYGEIRVLNGVSISVAEGEINAILGANGAGKTTTLRTISGVLLPEYGEIYFEGKRIDGSDPAKIVQMGIVQVPEGREIFPNLTVKETLLMGAFTRSDKTTLHSELDWIFTLFPVLQARIRQDSDTLSGGEQQMLAIGRALLAKPRLLMLDEPSLGLSPILVKEIFRVLQELNEQRMSILLVEQNVRLALNISHKGSVLDKGMIVMSGTPQSLMEEDKVRESYLGEGKGKYVARRKLWSGIL